MMIALALPLQSGGKLGHPTFSGKFGEILGKFVTLYNFPISY
ncbi:MAG: hypothetical protein ACP5J6_10790 [Candidatus Saccharicenans sp.]